MDRSKVKRVILSLLILNFVHFALLVTASVAEQPQSVKQKKTTYTGILYGYIHDVRPDFSAITVKPEGGAKRRYRIHLDPKTIVYVDKKRKKSSDLFLGDKVAVRYFGQEVIRVADAVYVIFGEFVPKDYVKKKKLLPIKKPGGGEKEGHKKEEKKGGH